MDAYFQGQSVRIYGRFFGWENQLQDPATIAIKICSPGWLISAASNPVHDGLGLYHVDVVADKSGLWTWRWETTGGVWTGDQGSFYVVGPPNGHPAPVGGGRA
jgi:hypothetical protein